MWKNARYLIKFEMVAAVIALHLTTHVPGAEPVKQWHTTGGRRPANSPRMANRSSCALRSCRNIGLRNLATAIHHTRDKTKTREKVSRRKNML